MYYFLIILTAVLFYVLVPALGMYHSYRRQQQFIQRTAGSRFYPLCPDHFIDGDCFSMPETGTAIRFFGKITSWENSRTMLLENQGLQVQVELTQNSIMELVPMPAKRNLAAYRLRKVHLQNISAVNLHTNVFVCGTVKKTETARKEELLSFFNSPENPLTVILFEGDSGQFFPRLLMASAGMRFDSGVIIPSLMTGFFSLLLIFTALVQTSMPAGYPLAAAVSLLSIISVVLPPGLVSWLPAKLLLDRAAAARCFGVYLRSLLHGLTAVSGDSGQVSASAAMPSGGTYALLHVILPQMQPVQLPPEIEADGNSRWVLFAEIAGGKPVKPADPFFSFTLIPGNPDSLLQQCREKSARWWLCAGGFLFAGIAANLYIITKLLHWAY